MLVNMKQALLRNKLPSYARYRLRKTIYKFFSDDSTSDYTIPAGTPGSGTGKGGGGGGSIRESGGGLGKHAAAQEEGYFHHKERQQLEKMKKQLKEGNFNLDRKPENK